MGVTKVTSLSQITDAIKADKVTLVHFVAGWAGPCFPSKAGFEGKAREVGDAVVFLEVEMTEVEDAQSAYHINALPTIIAFKKDKEIETIKGLAQPDRLDDLIKKAQAA